MKKEKQEKQQLENNIETLTLASSRLKKTTLILAVTSPYLISIGNANFDDSLGVVSDHIIRYNEIT